MFTLDKDVPPDDVWIADLLRIIRWAIAEGVVRIEAADWPGQRKPPMGAAVRDVKKEP